MRRASPRPAGEVRRLVIEAATELFAERGYARTTTREITRRAGVTPYQLFAQFGSKAKLFEIATVEPYCALVTAYVESCQAQPLQRPVDELCREILKGLFDVFESRQGLVAALVIAHAHEDELVDQLAAGLATVDHVLTPLERFSENEARGRGYRGVDLPLAVRLTHGAVLAASLFRPWLGDPARTRQAEIDAMTDLMLRGLLDAPGRRPPERTARNTRRPRAATGTRAPARTRIVEAATDLFERYGYPGASTKRIAQAAGTAEPVLFSHFGSKSELFEVAVADGWVAAVSDHLEADEARNSSPGKPDVGAAIADMFDLLRVNRLSILALLEVELQGSEHPESLPDHGKALRQVLDRFESRLGAHPANAAHPGAPHLALCAVLGAAVLDAWVFTGRRPGRARLIRELEIFLLHGIVGR